MQKYFPQIQDKFYLLKILFILNIFHPCNVNIFKTGFSVKSMASSSCAARGDNPLPSFLIIATETRFHTVFIYLRPFYERATAYLIGVYYAANLLPRRCTGLGANIGWPRGKLPFIRGVQAAAPAPPPSPYSVWNTRIPLLINCPPWPPLWTADCVGHNRFISVE